MHIKKCMLFGKVFNNLSEVYLSCYDGKKVLLIKVHYFVIVKSVQ